MSTSPWAQMDEIRRQDAARRVRLERYGFEPAEPVGTAVRARFTAAGPKQGCIVRAPDFEALVDACYAAWLGDWDRVDWSPGGEP